MRSSFTLRLSALCTGALLIAACACPPSPDLARLGGESLATPEATISYFRTAFLDGAVDQQFFCISRELRQRTPELTLGNFARYQDRVQRFFEERIGKLESVRVIGVERDPSDPERSLVTVANGRLRERISLVRELSIKIQWQDEGFTFLSPPADGPLSEGFSDERILELVRAQDPARRDARAEAIHRFELSRDWKIAGIAQSDTAEEFRRYLESGEEGGSASAVVPDAASPAPGASLPDPPSAPSEILPDAGSASEAVDPFEGFGEEEGEGGF